MQIFFPIVLQCNSPLKLHYNSILKWNISSLFHQPSLPLQSSLALCLSVSHSLFLSVCNGGLFMVDLGMARSRWWCFFFCKVPLPLSPHSFSFEACTRAGLGSWFDLGMVVGWDWHGSELRWWVWWWISVDQLMVGLTKVWIKALMAPIVIFLNGFDRGLMCFFFFFFLFGVWRIMSCWWRRCQVCVVQQW